MRSILALSLTTILAATGCVSYDKDGDLEDTGIAGDDGSFHESPGDDGSDDPDPDDEQPDEDDAGLQLVISPPEAEQGDMFVAHITSETGDLSVVEEIRFMGDVELLGFDNRGDELVMSLSIDDDAVTGAVDIALILDDQTTIWFNSALDIFEAGSGSSAETYGDGSDECP